MEALNLTRDVLLRGAFKGGMAKVKPPQGESDFASRERRIRGQLKAFGLWKFAQGTAPEPVDVLERSKSGAFTRERYS